MKAHKKNPKIFICKTFGEIRLANLSLRTRTVKRRLRRFSLASGAKQRHLQPKVEFSQKDGEQESSDIRGSPGKVEREGVENVVALSSPLAKESFFASCLNSQITSKDSLWYPVRICHHADAYDYWSRSQ